jgi:anti-sigma factor RsiW
MAERDAWTEQDRADLVAYLDGELKGEAARVLEAKLQRNPQARAEAESLKRTWELLDHLPRAEPSPAFTERTLSRLATVHQRQAESGHRFDWHGWLLPASWAAGIVLAFAGGWLGYNLLVPWQPGERELVQDLRIIENKRLYEAVEDLEFLKQLDQPELFGEERPGS